MGDVAVFEVILQLVRGHDGAVVLAFRRGGTEVRQADRVLDPEQVIRREIGDIGRDLAGGQRREQRAVIDQTAAGEIEDAHAVFHRSDRIRADHALGVRRERNVDGDVVTVGIDLVKRFGVADGARQVPRGIDRQVRVVPVDLHAEGDGRIGDQHADRAEADDAEFFAEDLRPGEGRLAFFDELGDGVALALQPLRPVRARDDAAGGQQQTGQHQFLDGVGVGTGGVEHDDALFAAEVDRDVVDARARARDRGQTLRQSHIVHGRRTHEHAVGIIELIRDRVARAEARRAAGRDLVECADLHLHTLLTRFAARILS